MKMTYFGHSGCRIESAGNTILIDPFISGNPLAERAGIREEDEKADFILLTHGHADHIGDTVSIGLRTGALVVATNELAMFLLHQGCKVHPMGLGGSRTFPFGWLKFTLAHHSAAVIGEDGIPVYLGNPAGLLLKLEERTLYHAGDTALFSEMQWLGDREAVDLALLPVGDNFTMGMEDAVEAIRMIKPKRTVPIHYNTFPPIEVDIEAFPEMARDTGTEVIVLAAGESLTL